LDGLARGGYVLFVGGISGSIEWVSPESDPFVLADGESLAVGSVVLSPASSLAGRVTDIDGAPLAGVEVTAVEYPDGLDGEAVDAGTAVTGSDGRFSVDDLPVGDYAVEAAGDQLHVEGFAPGVRFASQANLVTTQAGTAVDVGSIPLRPAGSVRGAVVSALGAAVPDASVILMSMVDPFDGTEMAWTPVIGTTTDRSGAFAIGGLYPGEFLVWIDGGQDHVAAYYRSEFEEDAQVVDVIEGEITAVGTLALKDAAKIEGTVVGADGLPVAQTSVVVSEFRVFEDEEVWDVVATATTDELGAYAIGGLKAREYLVEVVGVSFEEAEDDENGLDDGDGEGESNDGQALPGDDEDDGGPVPADGYGQEDPNGAGGSEPGEEGSLGEAGSGQGSEDDDPPFEPTPAGSDGVAEEAESEDLEDLPSAGEPADADGLDADPDADLESSDVVGQIGVVTVPGATVHLPDLQANQDLADGYGQPESPGVLFDRAPVLSSNSSGGQVFDQYSSLVPGAGGGLSVEANPGTVAESSGVLGGPLSKAASKVRVAKAKVKANRGKRVVLPVSVLSSRSAEGGTVVAKIGRNVVGKARVRSDGGARLAIKAKFLKQGNNKVHVKFGGNAKVFASKAITVKVVVK
jgi:hypothetical protein